MIVLQMMLSILVSATNADLTSDAQKHLESAQWEQAAEILDELVHQEESPPFEVLFDRGIAHYQLGEFEVAAKSFDDALASTHDPMNRTFSAFNKGNAIYRQTLESLEGTGTGAPTDEALIELKDAKSQIKQVLESYRNAIKNDPNDLDARANAELAWRVLKMLDQMEEQMEKDQRKQEESENQEQDQEEQDQSGEQSQQENQQGSDSKQDQSDEEQQSDQQSDSQNSQDSESQEQQKGEQSEDSQNQEQQGGNEYPDSQDSEQRDQRESEESQQEGELESIQDAANDALEEQQANRKEGNRLSKEEAARLLQLIRDKEKERREMLAAMRAANRIPVLRDW